jgi:hypothetical protein
VQFAIKEIINSKENQMVNDTKNHPENMRCANCPMQKKAQAKPEAILSRLWRWHTNWCPGWKAYQKALSEFK